MIDNTKLIIENENTANKNTCNDSTDEKTVCDNKDNQYLNKIVNIGDSKYDEKEKYDKNEKPFLGITSLNTNEKKNSMLNLSLEKLFKEGLNTLTDVMNVFDSPKESDSLITVDNLITNQKEKIRLEVKQEVESIKDNIIKKYDEKEFNSDLIDNNDINTESFMSKGDKLKKTNHKQKNLKTVEKKPAKQVNQFLDKDKNKIIENNIANQNEVNQTPLYTIELIAGYREKSKASHINMDKGEFLIKWLGYDEPTWEPYHSLCLTIDEHMSKFMELYSNSIIEYVRNKKEFVIPNFESSYNDYKKSIERGNSKTKKQENQNHKGNSKQKDTYNKKSIEKNNKKDQDEEFKKTYGFNFGKKQKSVERTKSKEKIKNSDNILKNVKVEEKDDIEKTKKVKNKKENKTKMMNEKAEELSFTLKKEHKKFYYNEQNYNKFDDINHLSSSNFANLDKTSTNLDKLETFKSDIKKDNYFTKYSAIEKLSDDCNNKNKCLELREDDNRQILNAFNDSDKIKNLNTSSKKTAANSNMEKEIIDKICSEAKMNFDTNIKKIASQNKPSKEWELKESWLDSFKFIKTCGILNINGEFYYKIKIQNDCTFQYILMKSTDIPTYLQNQVVVKYLERKIVLF